MSTDVQFGNAVYVNAPNTSFVDKHGRTGIVTKIDDLIWVRMDKSAETHSIEPEFVQRIWKMSEPVTYIGEKAIVHQPVINAHEGTVGYHIRYPDPLRGTSYVEHTELSDWVEPVPSQDEIIADLTEQLYETCRMYDIKRDAFEKLVAHGNRAMTIIGDRLIQEAEEHDWCKEYDEIISEVNEELDQATNGRWKLEERKRTHTVRLRRHRNVIEEAEVEVEVAATADEDEVVDAAWSASEDFDWDEDDSEVTEQEVLEIC